MALFVNETEAVNELNFLGAPTLYPSFSDEWIDDVRTRELTLAAPARILMPENQLNGNRFGLVTTFGHMVCKAAWKCQRRHCATDVLMQSQRCFEDISEPDDYDKMLRVVGKVSQMVSGKHLAKFELRLFDGNGHFEVIGRGRSILEIFNVVPNANSTPRVQRPFEGDVAIEAPEAVHGGIVGEVLTENPLPAAPPMPEAIPEDVPPMIEEDVQEVPVIDLAPVVPRRASFDPIGVRPSSRMSSENATERRAQPAQETFTFSFVNAKERFALNATKLRVELGNFGIEPMDISHEPMLLKIPSRFIYRFSVDSAHNAEKIRALIGETKGFEKFKVQEFESSPAFFYHELSPRKLLKAVVLSHKYHETVAGEEEVMAMVEQRECLVEALKDDVAMKEIKELLSARGKRELEGLVNEVQLGE